MTNNPLIGTIQSLPIGVTIPNHLLLCDGSTYDITDYPALFDMLGTNTLPDYRNGFLRQSNTPSGGSDTMTLSIANMPAHTHTYQTTTTVPTLEGVGAPIPTAAPGLPGITGTSGGGAPFSIVPRWHGVQICIVAK